MIAAIRTRVPTDLSGKVALVTGASRGIGAAVARGFGEAGAAVALASRDEAALERVADSIDGYGGRTPVAPTDVADPDAVRRMVERVLTTFGRLDYACTNAAGGGHPPSLLAEVSVEAFDSGTAVTLRPDEFAAAAVWLCSDQASFITGASLLVDGGGLAGSPPFNVNLRNETTAPTS